eukprot:685071-Pleurochrysis_carterae.AAC.1
MAWSQPWIRRRSSARPGVSAIPLKYGFWQTQLQVSCMLQPNSPLSMPAQQAFVPSKNQVTRPHHTHGGLVT